MAIINVNDISIYKNGWKSVKGQKARVNNAWEIIGNGSGIHYNGNWYVFGNSYMISYSIDHLHDYGTVVMYYLNGSHQAVEISNGDKVSDGTILHISGSSMDDYYLDGVYRESNNFYGYYPAGHYNGSLTPSISSDSTFTAIFRPCWGVDKTVYEHTLHLIINEDTTHVFDNLYFKLTIGSKHGTDSVIFCFKQNQMIDLHILANDAEGCWISITVDNFDELSTNFMMRYSYESNPWIFTNPLQANDLDFKALRDGTINNLYLGPDGMNHATGLMLPIMGDAETLLNISIILRAK